MYLKIQIILVSTLLLFGCDAFIEKTKQDLSNIVLIESGMSQDEVIKNIGTPAKTELNTKAKVLHYCNTGFFDNLVAIVLKDGKVLAVKTYILTTDDTKGKTGDCTLFFKTVDLDSTIKNGEIVFQDEKE